MKVILVALNNDDFMIPINNVVETVSISMDNINKNKVENIINVKGNAISVLNTKKILKIPNSNTYKKIIILDIEKYVFGILVDDLVDIIDYNEKKNNNYKLLDIDKIIKAGNIFVSKGFNKGVINHGTDKYIIEDNNTIELLQNIGKIARQLHDSIQDIQLIALDNTNKNIINTDIKSAIGKLYFVIKETEDASNKAISIAEKHISNIKKISSKLDSLSKYSSKEKKIILQDIKKWQENLKDDLIELITIQSFQDITGQIIVKIINLVNNIESELVKIIAIFGTKISNKSNKDIKDIHKKIEQNEVDSLLKEFGF